MAIEKVSTLLKLADSKKTSIIAFECTDYNMLYSAVAAADELSKPIIVMLDPVTHYDKNDSNPAAFAGMFKGVAEQFSVPVALHLDHSYEYKYILGTIRDGFRSVMYDGSKLSLEENIANSMRVTEAAHALGAEVEAELGRVGFAKDTDEEKLDMYTKPEVAAYFCEKTGVDSLAVAIGSAHGVYKTTPKLDLDRLEQINAATDVPLVLHGGSGIPDDQLHLAFQKGINKFNVGTEYFQLYYGAIVEFCEKYKLDKPVRQMPLCVLDLPQFVQKRLMDYMREKLLLCTL